MPAPFLSCSLLVDCGKLGEDGSGRVLYFRFMKLHIAAICFTERELELYVSQLQSQGFESLSEVKKAEDGSFYRILAKASKFDLPVAAKAVLQQDAALAVVG
jgi:hypothetical protein